jgi:hypothetical protein
MASAIAVLIGITGRPTKQSMAYDCDFSDGIQRTQWDAAEAHKMQAYVGQTLSLQYDEKPGRNGRVYRDITEWSLAQGGAIPIQAPAQVAPIPIQAAPVKSGGYDDPLVIARMTKMASQGKAVTLVAALYAGAGPEALDEALLAVRNVSKALYTDARSHEAEQTGQIIPTASTPQEVAAAVPGVTVGATEATAKVVDWT